MKHLPHHGILFEYNHTGVLLTGESGIGKSDIMLQLLQQHRVRLVCDDAPLFFVKKHFKEHSRDPMTELTKKQLKEVVIDKGQDKTHLLGYCNKDFSGMLHLRDLGIIHVPSLFGENSITEQVAVKLIIHLTQSDNNKLKSPLLKPEYERLIYQHICLYRLNLNYNDKRPMALLIITAIKQFCLKQANRDPAEVII